MANDATIMYLQKQRRFLRSHPDSVTLIDAELAKYPRVDVERLAFDIAMQRADYAAREAFESAYRNSLANPPAITVTVVIKEPTMTDRTFPILNTDQSVPYAFVDQFAQRLHRNHSQSVNGLAGRGGLSWDELYFAMNNKPIPWEHQINRQFPFEKHVRKAVSNWESDHE